MTRLALIVFQVFFVGLILAKDPLEVHLSIEGENAYLTIRNLTDDTLFIGDPKRSRVPLELSSDALSKGVVLNEESRLNDHFKFLIALFGSNSRNADMTTYRFRIPGIDAKAFKGADLSVRLWVATIQDLREDGVLALRLTKFQVDPASEKAR